MLYGLVIGVHVAACIALIAVILLQAGRGGGLSETFGGESRQTIFGTKATVFLSRATIVVAIGFLCTSLLLGILTSKRGKSLINLQGRGSLPVQIPMPEATQGTETMPDTKDLPLAEPKDIPNN